MLHKNILNKKTNGSSDNEKKSQLLTSLDESLEKIGLEYGPIVYEELKSRLEITISDFNNDLDKILKTSFKKYNDQKKTLDKNFDTDEFNPSDEGLKPKYISDYEKTKKKKSK